jgi:hypothetical protein
VEYVVGAAAEQLDDVAEDRQAGIAHDGLEAATRRRLGERVLLPVDLQQPLLDQPHAGDRVHRRRQPSFGLIQQVLRGADARH